VNPRHAAQNLFLLKLVTLILTCRIARQSDSGFMCSNIYVISSQMDIVRQGQTGSGVYIFEHTVGLLGTLSVFLETHHPFVLTWFAVSSGYDVSKCMCLYVQSVNICVCTFSQQMAFVINVFEASNSYVLPHDLD
jgi:hypothetical protein